MCCRNENHGDSGRWQCGCGGEVARGKRHASSSRTALQPENSIIRPGAIWLDTAGQRIYAGGGGMYVEGGTYWWIGEGEKVS